MRRALFSYFILLTLLFFTARAMAQIGPFAFTSGIPSPTAVVGVPYGHTFTTNSAVQPNMAAIGLPAWLTFNPATGAMIGTPSAEGGFGPITVTATNGAGVTISQTFRIDVITRTQAPSGPSGTTCVPGLLAITCSFTPTPNDTPTSIMLTCTDPAKKETRMMGSGTAITVTGLAGNTTYNCVLTAYNSAGSASSGPIPVRTGNGSTTPRRDGTDMDGDGRDDVLVFAGNTVYRAPLDSQGRLNFSPMGLSLAGRRVLGVGDFAGRGRMDILFQEIASGDVKIWRPDAALGQSAGKELFVRNVKSGWVVKAVADIDGDGRSDIVWRYITPDSPDSGVVFVWYMADNVVTDVRARGGAPLDWMLVGATDLNGDGMWDLVWVSPKRDIRAIIAKPEKAFVNQLVGTVPEGYTLSRLADFSGDGKGDLLFRGTSSQTRVWVMNGVAMQTAIDLPANDGLFELFAIADINGDGAADILWRRADNTLVAWLMNPAALQTPVMVDPLGQTPVGAQAIKP